MVGAGSIVMLFTRITLVARSFMLWSGVEDGCFLDLHTFAKWPARLHVWHTRWKAGHCFRPPGWYPDPHPGHICFRGLVSMG